MLSILCCTLSYYSTFLDDRHFRDVATAVSGHREVGHLYLGWGQEGGCTHGRVIEDGGAVALPTAFPPVAVNSCLKLDGGAQPSLFTFIRVEVLHIPAGEKRNPMLYSPSPRSVTLSHTLSINHLISAGSGVGLKEKKNDTLELSELHTLTCEIIVSLPENNGLSSNYVFDHFYEMEQHCIDPCLSSARRRCYW